MTLQPLYDPTNPLKPMQVLAFGSGSGTNIEALLHEQFRQEHILGRPKFEIAAILTNKKSSDIYNFFNGKYMVPIIEHSNVAYAKEKGHQWSDVKGNDDFREEYDHAGLVKVTDFMDEHDTSFDLAVLGGYMLKLTKPWLEHFGNTIINVHPADLRILDEEGKRKYVGDDAVYDAYVSGDSETRSSIHIVQKEVDLGPVVVVSEPLDFPTPYSTLFTFIMEETRREPFARKMADTHQKVQKMECDWPAYITAVNLFAEGRVLYDTKKNEVTIAEKSPESKLQHMTL